MRSGSVRHRLAGDALWLVVAQIARMGALFLASIIILRDTGPVGFGELSYALALAGIGVLLTALGMQSLLVREFINEPDSTATTFVTATSLRLVAACGFVMLAGVGVFIAQGAELAVVAVVACTSVVFRALDVADQFLQSQHATRVAVAPRVAAAVVTCMLVIALSLRDASVLAYAGALAVEPLVGGALVVLRMRMRRDLMLRGRRSFASTRARALLRDSWPLLISSAVALLYLQATQVFVLELAGRSEAGIYGAAARVPEALYFLPVAIITALFPHLVQSRTRGPEQFRAVLQLVYDGFGVMSVVLALLLTALSPFIVTALFGAAFDNSLIPLVLLVWTVPVVFLREVFFRWVVIENVPRKALQGHLVGAVVNIIGCLTLVPAFGATGAAASVLAALVASTLVLFPIMRSTRDQGRLMWAALLVPISAGRVYRAIRS